MKVKMLQEVKEITLAEGIDLFIKEKRFLNLSEESIKTYHFILGMFAEFYGADSPCKNITINTVHEFIEHRKQYARKRFEEIIAQGEKPSCPRELSDQTVASYIRTVRVFLYFLMHNSYLESFEIKNIKLDENIKETYTDKEIEALLKKPNLKVCSFSEYRTWVMINYLVGTGNRLGTVRNLKIGDIDFDSMYIVLTKLKGRRQYIIPLSTTLAEVLQEYLQYRKGEPEDYLFCTEYGGQFSITGMQGAIKRYNLSRGVTKTSMHLFRHYFAKKYILSGGDPFRLQRLLAHRTLEMTKHYVNLYSDELASGFDEFNPLDQLSKKEKRTSIKMKK